MKQKLLLVLLVAFLVSLTSCEEEDYLTKMARITEDANEGVIELDNTNFVELVQTRKQDAYFAIFFTKDKCADCQEAGKAFSKASYSYRYSKNHKKLDALPPVFFGSIYYRSQEQLLFKKYGVQSAPVLVVTSAADMKAGKLNENMRWNMLPGEPYTIDKQLEFLNRCTRRQVEAQYKFTEILINLFQVLAFISILLLIVYMMKDVMKKPIVWFILSCLVFGICIGGVVHNILHGVPLTGYTKNEDGKNVDEYIYKGSRMQYAGEGFLASFLMLAGGIVLIALSLLRKLAQNQAQMRVYALFIVVIFLFIFFALFRIYVIKTPWYNINFWPPDNYISGPLMNDQGNSF